MTRMEKMKAISVQLMRLRVPTKERSRPPTKSTPSFFAAKFYAGDGRGEAGAAGAAATARGQEATS